MASNALCQTAACTGAASAILDSLSPNYKTIDACTNFESLVCDGWRDHNQMRADQSGISSFSKLDEQTTAVLRQILESPYPAKSNHSEFSPMQLMVRTSTADEDNFDTMQRAYNSCIALDTIKQAGTKPLVSLLTDLSGVLNGTATTAAKGWGDAILFLQRIGISSLFSLGVDADLKNPDITIVFASPRSNIGLPSKSYYKDKSITTDYSAAISAVFASVLPSSAERSAAASLAAGVLDLETKIATATPELQDLRDDTKSYNIMTLKDTAALAPNLGIDYIISSLAPKNVTVDKLVTSFPDFFRNVSSIVSSSPKDTVRAYFYWKVIQATVGYVESNETAPYTRFTNKLNGLAPDARPDRWRTCVSFTSNTVSWIFSRFYVEKAFSAEAKATADKVVSDIKDQFVARLRTLDWMDDEVKKLAEDKVHAIVQKIGYPDKSPNITDATVLKKYYEKLNISSSHFDNALAANRFSADLEWSALGKPTDRDVWGMTAATINAYYNPPYNEIVFPAGILQYPFFDVALPKYINYGAYGSVAGHELSHAFDNSGRNYDVNGHLADWWTNRTVAEFEKRADCFVQEYSNMTVPGPNGTTLNVNGAQTLGENIADAGGLSASYGVWKKLVAKDADQNLPGLDFFTQDQLFYVAYGSVFCGKSTLELNQRRIATDPHSPNNLRIVGAAMMNSRGFREAFKCPAKEPVCELW